MERRAIREHLLSRGWDPDDMRLHFRVVRIQERLRRDKPSYRERQEAARARGERWVSPPPGEPVEDFTREELERLVELFAEANDPVTREIARKAQARLD